MNLYILYKNEYIFIIPIVERVRFVGFEGAGARFVGFEGAGARFLGFEGAGAFLINSTSIFFFLIILFIKNFFISKYNKLLHIPCIFDLIYHYHT